MAKVSFTKLVLKKNIETKNIEFNNENIEIKQYLPMEEKIHLIENVVSSCRDDRGYENPIETMVYTTLNILYYYTNIHFTEKQKEDPLKIYDEITTSSLDVAVLSEIPESEIKILKESIQAVNTSLYSYKTSFMGMLENAHEDYDALNLNADEIQKKLSNPESFTFVKDVLEKMG